MTLWITMSRIEPSFESGRLFFKANLIASALPHQFQCRRFSSMVMLKKTKSLTEAPSRQHCGSRRSNQDDRSPRRAGASRREHHRHQLRRGFFVGGAQSRHETQGNIRYVLFSNIAVRNSNKGLGWRRTGES